MQPITHRCVHSHRQLALIVQGLRALMLQTRKDPAENQELARLVKRLESVYRGDTQAEPAVVGLPGPANVGATPGGNDG